MMDILLSDERFLQGDERFTQTEVADLIEVSRSLLSRWKKQSVLLPSLDPKRDSTTQGREMRSYTIADLVAGFFMTVTREYLGFEGETLHRMTAMVQRADRVELENSEVLTVRTNQRMVRHVWVPDMRPEFVVPQEFGGGTYPSGSAWVEELELGERLRDRASLVELVKATIVPLQAKLDREDHQTLAKLKSEE